MIKLIGIANTSDFMPYNTDSKSNIFFKPPDVMPTDRNTANSLLRTSMVFEIVLHTFSPIIIVIKTVKMQTII